jgi:hypothetical protein
LDDLDEAEKWERYERWQHTASISSLIANIYRDPDKKREPFTWADFNPLDASGEPVKEKEPQTPEEMAHVAKMIVATMGGKIIEN